MTGSALDWGRSRSLRAFGLVSLTFLTSCAGIKEKPTAADSGAGHVSTVPDAGRGRDRPPAPDLGAPPPIDAATTPPPITDFPPDPIVADTGCLPTRRPSSAERRAPAARPCIVSPEPNTLMPRNWLRPKISIHPRRGREPLRDSAHDRGLRAAPDNLHHARRPTRSDATFWNQPAHLGQRPADHVSAYGADPVGQPARLRTRPFRAGAVELHDRPGRRAREDRLLGDSERQQPTASCAASASARRAWRTC